MDSNATKFIYLAVGIFISLGIITGLILSLSAYVEAFDIVESSSLGIRGDFLEVEKYNGVTLKGMDVLNVVKKYAEDDYVSVIVKLAGAGEIYFEPKKISEKIYESRIDMLRNYLNKETASGLSYYNKSFKFDVEGLDKIKHKEIDNPVIIRVREV